MTDLRTRLDAAKAAFLSASDAQRAEWARTALFWLFWASVVTFPLGQAFREAGPLLCLAALLPYHYWGYGQSTLRRFPLKWLFALFYGLICVKTVFSLNPSQSLGYVLPNLWKGFALPFIAMECARNARDLRRLIWAFAIACCYEGLDGVYQHITGHDLIRGTAIMRGRLTGSMSTYRVGNYMALALAPAMGLWWLLPRAMPALKRAAIMAALLLPGLHLLVFAQARSGYLGLAAALFVVWLLLWRPRWYWISAPFAAIVAAMFLGPKRILLASALKDERLEVWDMALEVARLRPLTGWGMGMFSPASKSLGLDVALDATIFQHPHSVYVQFLVDTGVVGLAIALLFLFGMLAWAFRHHLRNLPSRATDPSRCMWTLGAFFVGAWACYLAEALFAHDFLRTWWMAVSMGHLGVMIGVTVNALQAETASRNNTDGTT